MFGKCKVCAEKDARIADLKAQIASLHNLLQPVRAPANPEVHHEANAVLNGVNEQIEPELSPEILAERDALLSGTY